MVYGAAVLIQVIHNWPGVQESHELPSDYQAFFAGHPLPGMIINATSGFRNRKPVSNLEYGDYDMLLTSIPVDAAFSLKNDLELTDRSRSFGFVPGAAEFEIGKVSGLINMNPGSAHSKARLQLNGDSLSSFELGDSIRGINVKLVSLNFYFEGNNHDDFCFQTEPEADIPEEKSAPVTLLFRKKDDRLYICLISPKESRRFIPQKELFSLTAIENPPQ